MGLCVITSHIHHAIIVYYSFIPYHYNFDMEIIFIHSFPLPYTFSHFFIFLIYYLLNLLFCSVYHFLFIHFFAIRLIKHTDKPTMTPIKNERIDKSCIVLLVWLVRTYTLFISLYYSFLFLY